MLPLGANLYKNFIHLAIHGVLGLQWAVGTIIWATSRSIHFQKFCVHNEPQWPTGATICIIHEWHIGWVIVYLLDPHWALRATIHQRHIDLAILWVLSAQWAVRALYEPKVNRCPVVIGATRLTICRSSHLRTFCIPREPPGPQHINVMYISLIYEFQVPSEPQEPLYELNMNGMQVGLLKTFMIPTEPWEPLYERLVDLDNSCLSGSSLSPRSHYTTSYRSRHVMCSGSKSEP